MCLINKHINAKKQSEKHKIRNICIELQLVHKTYNKN